MRGRFFLLLILLSCTPFVSAEILLSQPQSLYNFGDELGMSVTLSPPQEVTDFVNIELQCDDREVTLYQNLLTMASGTTQTIPLSPRLESVVFADFEGTCTIQASYGVESAESQTFTLTRNIITTFSLPATTFNPQQAISLSGTAHKANGEALNGFVRVRIDEKEITTHLVTNGAFLFNITLAEDIAAGQHAVRLETYEESARGDELNKGEATEQMTINSVLTRIDITLQSEEITPGTSTTYVMHAYDQTGQELERELTYNLYEPEQTKPAITRRVLTNTEETLSFPTNSTAGYWKVEAVTDDYTVKKLVYIQELEYARLSLENNDTLIITNEGNVPYDEHIEIAIGEYNVTKEVHVEVGQTKRFKLKAPEAYYNIEVRDGSQQITAMNVPLTGRAIDIGEVNGSILNLRWAGLFILGILALALVTNTYIIRKRTRGVKRTSEKTLRSTSSTYLTGQKENATVLALRTATLPGKQELLRDEALEKARQEGGIIKQDATHHLVTFSPRFTKKLDNDLIALQVAKEMEKTLKDTTFGIGIGKGEVISDSAKPDQISSMGTIIPTAKRLANASQNSVIVSEQVYAALRTQVRAEKTANGWKINALNNRESHRSFIDNFIKRQNKRE